VQIFNLMPRKIMNTPQLKILFIGILLVALSACENYLGDDTNVDPNRSRTITLKALLPSCIESTARNHYLVALYTSQYAQHTASMNAGETDSYVETRIPDAWVGIYLTALTNLDVLVRQAAEQNSPYYAGIGKILQAINLGLATDTWGDVPFSQAFLGEANLTPAYDSQADIYAAIQQLLTDAISLLNQTTSLYIPAGDDLAYGPAGNTAERLDQWRKAAYMLKARYALHLTTQDRAKAVTEALAVLPQAFTAANEDLQLRFTSPSRNYWFVNVASPIGTGNYRLAPSEQIINMMNGTHYPVIDPRLPALFDNDGEATYAGITNGQGDEGTVGGYNSDITVDTWYGKEASPLLMATYSEQKFIEAEARFLNAGGTTTSTGAPQEAYDAYLAGIAAHFTKLGVDGSAYLADPAVAVGAVNLTLELIMKEKYIALFLHPEAWTDVRRYQYSGILYKGMTLPEESKLGDQFIQRVLYPLDEVNRNNTSVSPHVKSMDTNMWWNE
jgi:hypothetical protein